MDPWGTPHVIIDFIDGVYLFCYVKFFILQRICTLNFCAFRGSFLLFLTLLTSTFRFQSSIGWSWCQFVKHWSCRRRWCVGVLRSEPVLFLFGCWPPHPPPSCPPPTRASRSLFKPIRRFEQVYEQTVRGDDAAESQIYSSDQSLTSCWKAAAELQSHFLFVSLAFFFQAVYIFGCCPQISCERFFTLFSVVGSKPLHLWH